MNEIKKKICVWILLLIALPSCVSNSQGKELEELEREIIEVHDEVMPLMDPLYKIRKELLKKSEIDSTNIDLTNAIISIETAEETMMDWMRNYDITFKGNDPTETLDYFLEKKKSIELVAKEMKLAKKGGEGLLEKY